MADDSRVLFFRLQENKTLTPEEKRARIEDRIVQLKQDVKQKTELIAGIEACLSRECSRDTKEIQKEYIDFCFKWRVMPQRSIPKTEEELLDAYLLFSRI